MINKVNSFNSPNSISFGNAKYASEGFKQFTKNAVELFDNSPLFKSTKKGTRIKKDLYYNNDGTPVYAMHIQKTFEDAVDMVVSVTQASGKKIKNVYNIILATFGKNDNYICIYSYNKETGKISDNARNQPITAKKNEIFERYFSRLLKPFINK
jgi:hypothetical protein